MDHDDRCWLCEWMIKNLLNENQLDVIPPGYNKALRHIPYKEITIKTKPLTRENLYKLVPIITKR